MCVCICLVKLILKNLWGTFALLHKTIVKGSELEHHPLKSTPPTDLLTPCKVEAILIKGRANISHLWHIKTNTTNTKTTNKTFLLEDQNRHWSIISQIQFKKRWCSLHINCLTKTRRLPIGSHLILCFLHSMDPGYFKILYAAAQPL